MKINLPVVIDRTANKYNNNQFVFHNQKKCKTNIGVNALFELLVMPQCLNFEYII